MKYKNHMFAEEAISRTRLLLKSNIIAKKYIFKNQKDISWLKRMIKKLKGYIMTKNSTEMFWLKASSKRVFKEISWLNHKWIHND